MKIIITIAAYIISFNCNSQNIEKVNSTDTLFNKLILGMWKIGESEFTYFKNGTYNARLLKGEIDSGSWHIKEGKFVIKPEPFGFEREYNIIYLSSRIFRYQLTNRTIDDSIYTEKKIFRPEKTVLPFKELLKNMDTLIFRGSPTNNRSFKNDTLFTSEIHQLAELQFLDKKIQVEKYGVTPDGSISLYKNGIRIALVGCWSINKNEYGVNIAINGKFTYYGLTISKITFDKLFITAYD